MSDDANDVTKALAAFGAPSIRYHSFGQASVRPSSVVLPRRVQSVVAPAAVEPVVQQQEPVSAPEPVMRSAPELVTRAAPVPPQVPERRAAPMLRQAEPVRMPPAELSPTVAPPPRPLAEWAAPVAPPAPRPIVAPAPLVRSSVPAPSFPPASSTVVPPFFPSAPPPRSVSHPAPLAAPVPVSPPVHVESPPPTMAVVSAPPPSPAPNRPLPPEPAMHAPMPIAARDDNNAVSSQKPISAVPTRSLQEIFEYLISGSSRDIASVP